ncbi:MAG: group II intron reverse transcriptase/maturase [Peptococcaceae bacterium]|nr:group II intron reverse transcriptase/maturase [Peptococcaceae bacterium]
MKNYKVYASPHGEGDWHSIDWLKAQQAVKKLQMRIAKATREGEHYRVKSLQRTLTRSFSAKAIAVKRVTENQGKRTPGVDMETWSTPKAKAQGIIALRRRGYTPSPLRRVLIPKSNGKMRPLGIPTMKDRAMQALHLMALEPVAETRADGNSYGFRQGRATADAMEQGFNALSRKKSPQWILEGDIKACFDEISHEWLLANVPMDKRMLKAWLKAGYVYQKKLFPTEAGTPQGGIISPCLANFTLDGLEKVLKEHFRNRKVNFIRYADDFVVTGESKEVLTEEVKPMIEDFLKVRGLELSQEKTKITHIDEGFTFLGWHFRKYSGKLIIKPADWNIKNFLAKVRKVRKDNKSAKQENLIQLLNPIVRGWSNYHKPVCAKETFSKVDNEVWKILWQWAKRRHPEKNYGWVKNHYFGKIGNQTGIFKINNLKLLMASDTKIQRHVKIKSDANPFDKKWEMYFEERLFNKMKGTLRGSGERLTLWMKQNGKCLNCRTPMDLEKEELNTHHILPLCEGGKDIISNLVLLHGNCHRQVHNRKVNGIEAGCA